MPVQTKREAYEEPEAVIGVAEEPNARLASDYLALVGTPGNS